MPFRHFQHYLTGLIVLDNKSLANITRCVQDSADKTNLSRFFSDAPWFQDQVNDRRLTYLLQQTQAVRGPKADGALILDDTLCEHVGSLFDYVDRHYIDSQKKIRAAEGMGERTGQMMRDTAFLSEPTST